MNVETLLEAVQRLPPRQRREFEDRFDEWKMGAASDGELIAEMKLRLSGGDEARLRNLVEKSENGQLSQAEKLDYQRLAKRAEMLTVRRVRALTALAERRGIPLEAVM